MRGRLRTTLREAHETVARAREKGALHNSRFLRVLGENATIKAGLQLLAQEPESREARLTLIDQLRELAETQSFELIAMTTAEGRPVGGVRRQGERWETLDARDGMIPGGHGFFEIGGQLFEFTPVPINLGEEAVGILTVGEVLKLNDFPMPMALTQRGRFVKASLEAGAPALWEQAWSVKRSACLS